MQNFDLVLLCENELVAQFSLCMLVVSCRKNDSLERVTRYLICMVKRHECQRRCDASIWVDHLVLDRDLHGFYVSFA